MFLRDDLNFLEPALSSQIRLHQYDLALSISHHEQQEVAPSLQSFPAEIEQVQENLDRHAETIKKGCERDIRLVDNRLRLMEKKMWSIFGGLAIISFVVSPIGQRIIRPVLTPSPVSSIIVEK